MNNDLFISYRITNKVDSKVIEKYKGKIPNELITVWERYGFGSLLNGYLKVINPEEYQEIVEMSYFRANVSIPIFVTAFGDIINWEENNYIRIVKYKNGTFKGIASGFEFFWDDIVTDYFRKKYFEVEKYEEAIAMWGELEYDQCFGYVPLLGLGGSEKVENLKKVKIKEHIELITQLMGKIE